mmetsp:Transcript_30386/g.83271  ORF Transcript_30386/g.83271 Transcript_30386/m.83271 type:complete len:208 (+) Transcript_30386:1417-2040(+)
MLAVQQRPEDEHNRHRDRSARECDAQRLQERIKEVLVVIGHNCRQIQRPLRRVGHPKDVGDLQHLQVAVCEGSDDSELQRIRIQVVHQVEDGDLSGGHITVEGGFKFHAATCPFEIKHGHCSPNGVAVSLLGCGDRIQGEDHRRRCVILVDAEVRSRSCKYVRGGGEYLIGAIGDHRLRPRCLVPRIASGRQSGRDLQPAVQTEACL